MPRSLRDRSAPTSLPTRTFCIQTLRSIPLFNLWEAPRAPWRFSRPSSTFLGVSEMAVWRLATAAPGFKTLRFGTRKWSGKRRQVSYYLISKRLKQAESKHHELLDVQKIFGRPMKEFGMSACVYEFLETTSAHTGGLRSGVRLGVRPDVRPDGCRRRACRHRRRKDIIWLRRSRLAALIKCDERPFNGGSLESGGQGPPAKIEKTYFFIFRKVGLEK